MDETHEDGLPDEPRQNGGPAPPKDVPALKPGSTAAGNDIESREDVHAAVDLLVSMVNDADQLLPPQAVEGMTLTTDHPFSYATRQYAANVKNKLIRVLAMFGVEPMQVVGTDVDYVRHDGGGDRATEDSACHNKVAACLLTGFTKGGKVIRKPLVEVFQYHKPEQEGEVSPQEEG